MSVQNHRQLGRLIVNHQRYRSSASNKNVDIKLCAHDVFLDKPSSVTLKATVLEIQTLKSL